MFNGMFQKVVIFVTFTVADVEYIYFVDFTLIVQKVII